MIRLIRPATELVERIYDVDLPAQAWLESIRHAAERSFAGHIGVQAYMFRVTAAGSFKHEEVASEHEMEVAFRLAHQLAAPELIREIYLRRPVVSLTRAIVGRESDPGYKAAVDSGLGHNNLALGIDPSGVGCALVLAQGDPGALSRPARQVLERISAHLGSARRLRGSSAGAGAHERVEAIINADGVVVHAESDARDPEARRALREAAKRIDRARLPSSAVGDGEALGLWRALVDGRWSLVERFDSDGRRLFVARRNDPTVRRTHVLRENERKVVAMLAMGHSAKLCAYELGLAQSTVSDLASTAMRKLGVRSRAELVELHGAIVALAEPASDSDSG